MRYLLMTFFLLQISCAQEENAEKAVNFYLSSQYEKAIHHFDKAIEKNPNNGDLYVYRASSYRYLKKFTMALSDCHKALELGVYNAYLHSLIGDVYFKQGDIQKSLANYLISHQIDNEFESVNYNIAVCYFELYDCESTVKYCSREITLNADFYDAYKLRAECLIILEKYSEAKKDLEFILKNENSDRDNYLLGLVYFNKENYNEALKFYNKALILDSIEVEYYVKRAATYGVLDSHYLAIKDCNKILSIDPKNSDAFLLRGNAYKNLGFYDKACSDFDRVKDIKPEEIKANNFYINVCDSLK